jgi:hypothetical protein
VAATICAILALVCLLLALLGASIGVDMVTLGLSFGAAWMIVTSPYVAGRVR